jgi:hypothetical protein
MCIRIDLSSHKSREKRPNIPTSSGTEATTGNLANVSNVIGNFIFCGVGNFSSVEASTTTRAASTLRSAPQSPDVQTAVPFRNPQRYNHRREKKPQLRMDRF